MRSLLPAPAIRATDVSLGSRFEGVNGTQAGARGRVAHPERDGSARVQVLPATFEDAVVVLARWLSPTTSRPAAACAEARLLPASPGREPLFGACGQSIAQGPDRPGEG